MMQLVQDLNLQKTYMHFEVCNDTWHRGTQQLVVPLLYSNPHFVTLKAAGEN